MIRVYADLPYRDWVMDCDDHDEVMTCGTWRDAYEAAVGHACMQHPESELCETKGHHWRFNWDSITIEKYGQQSEPWVCRRCGELGWSFVMGWSAS